MTKSITTKQGDGGETGLLYGGRVSKTDPQIEANGAVDELVSKLGVARAHIPSADPAHKWIARLQDDLIVMGAEVATHSDRRDDLVRNFSTIGAAEMEWLDKLSTQLESEVEIEPRFVLPGSSIASAHLDVARTAARALERRMVELVGAGKVRNEQMVPYLNRLSDALFLMARHHDSRLSDTRPIYFGDTERG